MISKACVQGIYQRKLEEMARQDIELTVVVPPGWRDERGWIPLERAHEAGYRLLVTPMVWNGSFHLHFYPRLGRIVAQVRPHLIHIDEEPYNVATWHAVYLACRAGAQALFFTWQNWNRRYPPPFRWGEQYVYRHTACAIAGNRDAGQVLLGKGYTRPVYVIPQFGVDPALYTRASVPSGPFVIGYVGRLVPEKGVQDLLHAAAGLPGNWRLRLLGSGPQRAQLLDLARSLSIGDRVVVEEWIPASEVPQYLRQLHVLVLPSRTQQNWKEQFGRVLIEAMASGVPVIGSSSGEIPHVIGDAGLIFPEGDVEALRTQIHSLMVDRTLWRELAKNGRKRVSARFTQDRIARETVAVYREVLAGATSP